MNIKLLKEHKSVAVDSVVEVDEVTGKSLVEDGTAIEWTEEVQKLERKNAIVAETKSINIVIKKEVKTMEFKMAKMFQYLSGKAITGNAEDSAANGAALVTTGLADMLPLVMLGSQIYDKCLKIPVAQNANSMKVPFSISDMWTAGTAPVMSIGVAEGVAPTATKGQLEGAVLTLDKVAATVAITQELLEDAPACEAWLQNELVGKIASVLDARVLKGSGGFTGINGHTGYTLTSALSATPTVAEYAALINKVHPVLQPGSEFFMSITDWNLAVGAFLTSSNLNGQLIGINPKVLFGYPVNVVPTLAAGDVIFGNPKRYATIETPRKLDVSRDVRFLEGEVVYRISMRAAGQIVYKAHATGDSLSVAAFAEKA